MKKLLVSLVCIIVVAGCSTNSDDVENTYSIKYNDDYYSIYMPYKKGVSDNYILNSNVVDFDVETIEKDLIQISTNAFSVDKFYYQEGQYLTKTKLKELLGEDHLNKTDEQSIDGKTIKPKIVAGIYEKNFLNKNGDIKGISLGVVLNPYQAYDSNNNYVTMDNDTIIDFGKEASKKLIEYMRTNFKLDNIPILIALYVEASPESNVGGNYLYYGVTENNEIKFNYINQKNFYMNSKNVKELDVTNYNNFKKFEETIRQYDNSIYLSGLGYYNGDNLSKIDVIVTKSHYSYGELLYINQLLSENAMKYFKDVKVIIEVKAINDIKSYIVKEQGETSTDIFIY